jgi:hypothetical protein
MPRRDSALQNVPPMDTPDHKTPPKAPAHTYMSKVNSENMEGYGENQENEEDVHEAALQALASYIEFQRTLLRHIEIDPALTEFADQYHTVAFAEEEGFHSGRRSEDHVPGSEIGTGKRPENRF